MLKVLDFEFSTLFVEILFQLAVKSKYLLGVLDSICILEISDLRDPQATW
jgi:hypothetical protein